MKFIEEVNSDSSSWIKTKGGKYQKFYWQKGYGSFSVNPTEIDIVRKIYLAPSVLANGGSHHFLALTG